MVHRPCGQDFIRTRESEMMKARCVRGGGKEDRDNSTENNDVKRLFDAAKMNPAFSKSKSVKASSVSPYHGIFSRSSTPRLYIKGAQSDAPRRSWGNFTWLYISRAESHAARRSWGNFTWLYISRAESHAACRRSTRRNECTS
ncbi:uncharacterized protein LOC116290329 isoform X1 [Actinia tenebrosa]|uniref:Uncharacterized protein LOC116290329 isoform X1 n=1 Tax=Actinia tenebrosa TaxID=6105 RepID=A0A6P8HKH2_ACTTE|nr:uncharacterized protein LOC116290329 isoform X1 [Actinia tenebrosa]XP_031553193.1 uncharacterized protein LOC116290329 isoform X1 [Actinia tenebrosa]